MPVGDVTEVTATDAAWVAGFLDGEGSFSIRPQRSARDRHVTSTVATVGVSQAEPRLDALYLLHDLFGGAVSSHGTERRNPSHNRSMRWAVTGQRAVLVCRVVLPYLRLKRRHAELIIEHQDTKLPSHVGCRAGTKRSDVRIAPEVLALRAAHISEIKALNTRGLYAGG